MDVKNLRDLKNVMALCKKQGVKSIEISGIKMEFSDDAIRPKPRKTKLENEIDLTAEREYSPEDLAFWSAN